MRPSSDHVRPMPHPGQWLIPVDAPTDRNSFTDDSTGSLFAMIQSHWYHLNYLGEFHCDHQARPIAFEMVDPAPFSDAFQAWGVASDGISMQILRYDLGNGYDMIAYRFHSEGPIGVDIRLTAPDLASASSRLIGLRQARVRLERRVPKRMTWDQVEKIFIRGHQRRIGQYAPLLTLLQPSPDPEIVWMRRWIRDPYMATLREMRNGTVNVIFHGEEIVLFEVRDRALGLERIEELFKRLVVKR